MAPYSDINDKLYALSLESLKDVFLYESQDQKKSDTALIGNFKGTGNLIFLNEAGILFTGNRPLKTKKDEKEVKENEEIR